MIDLLRSVVWMCVLIIAIITDGSLIYFEFKHAIVYTASLRLIHGDNEIHYILYGHILVTS